MSAIADGITTEAKEVLSLAAMSTNVAVSEDEDGATRFDGLPTEVALVRAIDPIKSRDDLLTEYPVVDQVPFNSTKK